MLPTTLEVVKASLKADPTLDPTDRVRISNAVQAAAKSEANPGEQAHRLLRRGEVARRLSVSLRTIDKLHTQGILTKVNLPGRGRAAGFRLSDVEALIGGAQ
jgi:hypothetical protein